MGSLIGISSISSGQDENPRVTLSVDVTDATRREYLLVDPGPEEVRVRWIYSADKGITWKYAPRQFLGRLSEPLISDGRYTVDIVSHESDVDRGVPLRWSGEEQRRRNPTDYGMEFMRRLSEGIETKWPP